MKFNRWITFCRNTSTQLCCFIIINFSSTATHGTLKYTVYCSKNIPAAAKITAKKYFSCRCITFFFKLIIFCKKQAGICETKTVNALFDITDHEQSVISIMYTSDNCFLYSRYILIFVNKDRVIC